MKNDFLRYQALTSPHPLAIEIASAKGSYIYDTSGKEYLDFVAGVSATSLGHSNPIINRAIATQLESHSHVMVYGEFAQKTPVALCKLLIENLPDFFEKVYLTNSGTEATEGAMKLAKRATGRFEIIAAKNAYHGNTQGAMSVCGAEEQNRAFRPLVPGIKFINYNVEEELEKITKNTAAVLLETIQGGAGFIQPQKDYLRKVKERCETVGALLILDEIQTGIGRTGTLYGFQNYNVTPDIFITGKGLGGGMPIGAFVSSAALMDTLQITPKLGHITTFGGHPVIAAAALATLETLFTSTLMQETLSKEQIIRDRLEGHSDILEIRGKGLMLALLMKDSELATKVVLSALEHGLVLFFLLYEKRAVRISPPLTISEAEIHKGCDIILEILNT